MIYPYLTLNDGTEYTHSEMKADGTVLVYVETPDAEDGFHSLLCVLPKYEIKDVIGYTKDEQEKILARIKKMKDCRWSLFMCMFPMECHMQMQPKYG